MRLQTMSKSADEENFDKMRSAYDACLDEDEIKNIGVEPLLRVLEKIKKTFPIDSKGSLHTTKDVLLLLARYGVTGLVTTGAGADDKDPDTVVVSVGAPWSFGLPSKERYEDKNLVEKYRGVTLEVLKALYPDQDTISFSRIIDLEKKLAAASPSEEDREDVTAGYMMLPFLGHSLIVP